MSKRRIETKASQTAGYTCFSRACAAREKDPRFRGPDHLAEVILPAAARWIVRVPLLRKFFMNRIFPAGIYEYVLARTMELDAAFVEALDARFDQIVLLGAGFARPGRAGPGTPAHCGLRTATGERAYSNWTSPRRWNRNGRSCIGSGSRYPMG